MVPRRLARLSTGVKMLLILSIALLPLGLIALFASIETAQTNRISRQAEAQLMVSASADRLNLTIAREALILRGAMSHIPASAVECHTLVDRLAAAGRHRIGIALFAESGRRLCATDGFSPLPAQPPARRIGTEMLLMEQPGAVRFVVDAGNGGIFGVGELPLDKVRSLILPVTGAGAGAALIQGTGRLLLSDVPASQPLTDRRIVTAPVAGGQLALELTVNSPPITAIEIILVLLPVLMWLAASLIGWLVVDRLLLRPLAEMQKAITDYRAGQGDLVIPRFTTPAREIKRLGEAFARVTNELAAHEAQLEHGLARQTRLTREVHHRVKNNLQVVASLINLHARGAKDGAVSAAYASIQRRVDALAVVHRNHYAELEENRGVSLRALIGELAANLRATAPPDASGMMITLNIVPAFVTQDVAVPIAFLITEIVEMVMDCDPRGAVAITLEPIDRPDRGLLTIAASGLLTIAASGLLNDACAGHPSFERYQRIITGLSRQLRSTLHHEPDSGRYAIEIAIAREEE